MSLLLVLTWLVPLVLAALARRPSLWWIPAIGALPALAAALLVPLGTRLELEWLLVGAVLGLDAIDRIFLLFTAILWLAAGLYAAITFRGSTHGGRFNTFFLLAMTGNLWLIVGLDLVSFYVGFALMGISSYGLVIHDGNRAALRAGKVYLVLTLAAEVTLFAALVMIAAATDSIQPTPDLLVELDDLTIGLLILGLAVKAGLVPLHVWLPLAHPAAPIPASAVLSGAMIKVALLGWLRFLPIGEIALPGWGLLFVFAGLVTAFVAVPIGMIQSDPKVLLAYSSVSKMGLMAITLGLLLIEPELVPVAALGIALYAGHHALTKGGLFLGVGLRKSSTAQPWVLTGVLLLALSMAAVPLTSGAVAKYGIKPAFAEVEWVWLKVAIALTTIATALMMARLLWIIRGLTPHPSPGVGWAMLGWAPLIGLVLLYPLVLGSPTAWITDAGLIALAVVLGLPMILLARRRPGAIRPLIDRIQPGDLVGLVRPLLIGARWGTRRVLRAASARLSPIPTALAGHLGRLLQRPASSLDQRLGHWPTGGGIWLGILVLIIGLAILITPPSRPPVPRTEVADAPTPSEPRPEPTVEVDPAILPEPSPHAHGRVTAEPAETPAEPLPSDTPIDAAETRPEVTADITTSETPTPPEEPSIDDTPIMDTTAPEPFEVCDPSQPDEFSHAASGARIELERCVLVDGAPQWTEAPPLTNALVRLIQLNLNALGYDAGPNDGLIGPLTRGAIRRFQTAQGAVPTGAITFELLDRLRAAAESHRDP